jgi:GT2 family glycosyltransferase
LANPTVAVVILNYNGRNFIQQFLPSVLASSYVNKEIIVADNCSTDDSPDVLKQFSNIKILMLDKNYGFAEGYNQALQKVTADYYALLNSDVEVTPQWIEPIIQLMESDKKIAACQPKILSYKEKEFFEYAGAAGGWLDTLGYPFSRGRIFDEHEKDLGQYNDNAEIFWATGAAMFLRASVFHEVNGFDNFFFAHMEEIDLCWRLQLAGYKIMCCPASVVYHVGGGTLPKGNERNVYLNFRNNIIMLSKNLCMREKIWKLPLRFFLDMVFAFKNLFSGYHASFVAIFEAYISAIKWSFTSKNKSRLKKVSMKKLTGVHKGFIVWDYFIKRKKRFSEIVKKNL